MQFKISHAKTLTLAVASFFIVELAATPTAQAQEQLTEAQLQISDAEMQELNELVIKKLKSIRQSMERKLIGINALRTTQLTTDEIGSQVIQSLNFIVGIRKFLSSIPQIDFSLSHEIFHATNHITNIDEDLDMIQEGKLDFRKGYVRLVKHSVPIMVNVMKDVLTKAIKIMEFDQEHALIVA